MSILPIGGSVRDAQAADAPTARTAEEAGARVGGPVFLTSEELPERFATPEEAEAAFPELYGAGRYDLYWRDEAWRVALRYWRLAPPAPVARTVDTAVKKPLGRARTPEEARAILEAPAEAVSEALPQLYANRQRLMARWGKLVETGLAEIIEREGKFAVAIRYWRPMPSPVRGPSLAPGERNELAERIAAPMTGPEPQAPMDVGLFERVAPENPEIVLAEEEGDGRFRGE
ncbi:MAG: hypothetical protein JNJ73_13970 [Hyphomonadaceae bacterium]|nr:hypothetical protein [Hyphomonadaceae bacterium]